MTSDHEKCYLCGAAENLTREHIPPRCLFPKPRPSNLHTVPCCFTCNNTASQDDEFLRVATSMLINGNAQAKAAWGRVVESTLPKGRIRDRVAALGSSMKRVHLKTPMGIIAASQAQVYAEPINRCLVRITKGIIATSHPEVELRRLDFEITQIDQFKPDSLVSSGVAEKFTRWSIGDGVYQNWRAFEKEHHSRGIMVHMFYGAAIWIVKFEPGGGRVRLHGLEDWSHDAPGSR